MAKRQENWHFSSWIDFSGYHLISKYPTVQIFPAAAIPLNSAHREAPMTDQPSHQQAALTFVGLLRQVPEGIRIIQCFRVGGKVRWWTPATLYVKRQKLGNWAKDPSWLHTPQELPDLLNLVFSWWLPHVFIRSRSEYIPFFQDLVPLQQTKKLRGKKCIYNLQCISIHTSWYYVTTVHSLIHN